MGKDLLESPYGRFYYLPELLAERGHDVSVLLLVRRVRGVRRSRLPQRRSEA